ncbi:hypothetical protein [Streptomyces sp. NPDC000983]|uniref:hypothetical protein n=1 Tax=Streptomyces sp. NPDC000983 TaxID=3154373 RepID=UPI00331F8946
MTAENSGIDALMAAITDEPLPEGADDAFLAEHRSAAADIAVLREQLGIIGRALGEGEEPVPDVRPAPAPRPVRPVPPVRRRMFRPAVGSLAVAAAASVMAGLGWLVSASGTGANSDQATSADAGGKSESSAAAEAHLSYADPGRLACAALVAEAEVTSAEPAAGARVRVALEVTRIHQQTGKRAVTKEDPLVYVVDENTAPGLRVGDHVLFGVQRGAAEPDLWVVGERAIAVEREWITRSLPEARSRGCG